MNRGGFPDAVHIWFDGEALRRPTIPIPLSPDYGAASLRSAARGSKDANQTWRLLTLAAIYGGSTSTEVTMVGGVTVQIARDWVAKLNAYGPAGLIDRRGGSTPTILIDEHRLALAMAIEDRPGEFWYQPYPQAPRQTQLRQGSIVSPTQAK